MKRNQTLFARLGLATAALLVVSAQAAPFTYNPQDLLLGFRSASSVNDLVIDIGSASLFYNAAPGSIFNVGGFTGSQLSSAFGGLSGLSFSVMGDVRTTGDASHPLNTLWVTRARTDFSLQSDPWNRQSQTALGNSAGKIDGIANGALTFSGTVPADPNSNTATLVAVPKTWNAGGISYSLGAGPGGNLAGTFQGSIENTTPAGFESSGLGVRSDLYEVKPGSGLSTYLGAFEFGTDGTLKFYAVPEPTGLTCLAAGLCLLAAGMRYRGKNPS